jgi:hypothetical protein|tara:strand:+ start:4804 stop:5103 length:300 start_codon:yes stop_codon:yes gene_type:complete
MEIIEIISSYLNKSSNILRVEFRIVNDESTRTDVIEYQYIEEFGYYADGTMDVFEDYDTNFDEWETWEDKEEGFIDDETLILFLNEYYVVFPDRIPEQE